MERLFVIASFALASSWCESFRLDGPLPRAIRRHHTMDPATRQSILRPLFASEQASSGSSADARAAGGLASSSAQAAAEAPLDQASDSSRVRWPFKRAVRRVTGALGSRLRTLPPSSADRLEGVDAEAVKPLNNPAATINTAGSTPMPPPLPPSAAGRSARSLPPPWATVALAEATLAALARGAPLPPTSSDRSRSGWARAMARAPPTSPTGYLFWLSSWTWPLLKACRDLALSGATAAWRSAAGACGPVWQRRVAPPLQRWSSAHLAPRVERTWKQKGEPWMDRLVRRHVLPRMDKQALVGLVAVAAAELSARELDSAVARAVRNLPASQRGQAADVARALADTDLLASLGSQATLALMAALNGTVANVTAYSDQVLQGSLGLVKALEAFNVAANKTTGTAGTGTAASGNGAAAPPLAAYAAYSVGLDEVLAAVTREWSGLSLGSPSSRGGGSSRSSSSSNQTHVLDALLALDGSKGSLDQLVAEVDKALPALAISDSSTLRALLALNGTQAALDGVTRAALQDIATASEEWSGTLKLNPKDGRLVRTAVKALSESLRLNPQDRSSSSEAEAEAWAEVLAELDLRGRGLVGLSAQPSTLSAAQLYSGYTQGTGADLEALWCNWTTAPLPVDLAVDLRLRDTTPWAQEFFNGTMAVQARGGSGSVDLMALGKEAEAWVDAAGAIVVGTVVGTVGVVADSTATAVMSTFGTMANSTGAAASTVLTTVANATGSVGPAVEGWLSAAGSAVGSAAGWLGQAAPSKANATASENGAT